MTHPMESQAVFFLSGGAAAVLTRERAVDEKLKRHMKELGDAINDSLSDSERIAEVIARIKATGYDVFLVLEATIGFNRKGEDIAGSVTSVSAMDSAGEPDFSINAQDMKFLKSLRISVDEHDAAA